MHDTADTSDDATPDPDEGGYGGRCGRRSRIERLAARALRESWPVPDEIRGPLINRLAIIALDKETSPREATSATKAILAASKLNLEAITATIRAEEHEELVARVDELESKLAAGPQKEGPSW